MHREAVPPVLRPRSGIESIALRSRRLWKSRRPERLQATVLRSFCRAEHQGARLDLADLVRAMTRRLLQYLLVGSLLASYEMTKMNTTVRNHNLYDHLEQVFCIVGSFLLSHP